MERGRGDLVPAQVVAAGSVLATRAQDTCKRVLDARLSVDGAVVSGVVVDGDVADFLLSPSWDIKRIPRQECPSCPSRKWSC